MHIRVEYLPFFAKIYNRSAILEFIQHDTPTTLNNALKFSGAITKNESEAITYSKLFNKVYLALKKRYRCEYIYKNILLNQELLKSKHQSDVRLFNELAVGNSQADIVAINGTSTVYEIKTGLDTINRLPEQLSNYSKAFDIVNIITDKSKLSEIKNFLVRLGDKNTGVILLNENILETEKEAVSNIDLWDLKLMFSVLRQKQVKDHFGVKNLSEAEVRFCSLDKVEAHSLFRTLLYKNARDTEFIKNLPISLKMAGYALQNLTKSQKKTWLIKLQKPVLI